MAERILILAGPEFEDIELLYPLYRLMEAGYKVDVASHPRYGPILVGKHGYQVKMNRRIDEVDAGDYDALVIPGGKGPERIRIYEEAVEIVYRFAVEGKPIAAICHGPQLLVSASLKEPRILRGRRVTSVPSIRDDLLAAGAVWIDEPVVVDGGLVTSRVPDDIPLWMARFLEKLEG